MSLKNPLIEKPDGMTDEVWEIFLAHRKNEKEVSRQAILGAGASVEFVGPANMADLEETLAIARLPKLSLLAKDVEARRQERIRRSLDGE